NSRPSPGELLSNHREQHCRVGDRAIEVDQFVPWIRNSLQTGNEDDEGTHLGASGDHQIASESKDNQRPGAGQEVAEFGDQELAEVEPDPNAIEAVDIEPAERLRFTT